MRNINIKEMSREQWLKERKRGVGGSDVGKDEKTAYYAALRRLNEAEDKLRSVAVARLTLLVDSGIEITEDDKAEFRNVRLEKDRAYEAFDAAARKAWGKQ